MLLGGANRLFKSQLQLPAFSHPDLDDEIDIMCDDISLE